MNKKSQTYLIAALVCFLGAAGAVGYMVYEINQQGVRFTESKRLIAENEAKEKAYTTVQNLLVSTKSDRDKIKSYFIEEKQTIAFISDIEKSAKIVGVTLTTNELSIVPSITDANNVIKPALLIVGFDFVGAQNNSEQFLKLLENIPYHKKISEVSFSKTDTNLWRANVKMQLTLSI